LSFPWSAVARGRMAMVVMMVMASAPKPIGQLLPLPRLECAV
jgi:hypothetical protein